MACLSMLFTISGCRGEDDGTEGRESGASCTDLSSRKFDGLFWADSACGERVAAIRSIIGADTLKKYFVLRDSAAFAAGRPLPRELSGAMVLRVPLARVAVLSSTQIGYMLRLGLGDRIVAVGSGKYIADSALYYRVAGDGSAPGNEPADKNLPDTLSSVILSEAIKNGRQLVALPFLGSKEQNPVPSLPDTLSSRIAEVSPDGISVDYEKLMAIRPDLVMTFATGGAYDDYDRMEKLGIPVMLTSEWQETTLDAKAEWLRLFGALFGVEPLADSVLRESRDGFAVKAAPHVGEGACDGPRVLAGMSYGGVWHAPGGNSYTSDLIRRAGGCYLWGHDTSRELTLTLEDVMALADSVDVWINPGMFATPAEILSAEPRAAYIKAFKEKRVFQNDGRRGPGGGNDFYESAAARPLELVRNLRELFDRDSGKSYPSLTPRVPVQSPDSAKTPSSAHSAFEWYHNIF